MRKFASSFISFVFAAVLYGLQQFAKLLGLPSEIVNPKNPAAPGSTGQKPSSGTGYLYERTKRIFELYGDPAAVLFLAFDENQSKFVSLIADLFSGRLRSWRMLP